MKCIFTCLIVLCICFSSSSAKSYMALYEDYISDDPSLPHCNNGVFESPKHPVFGLQTAKCGCYDSETKTSGELVRIKDQPHYIRRGTFIYKVQCISRPLRRLTEHRLLDELLRRRMEALEEMEGEQDSLQDGFVESRRLRYVNSGFCCSLVKMEPNPLLCGHCSYGHRWSPSCGSTRMCKYRCKSDAERRRCKGSQCYKYADC